MQIAQALTAQPKTPILADSLRLTRYLTLNGYVLASAQPMPAIDLHEVYFEYNSAAITADALPQLRELGAALSDPELKGATISTGGPTPAAGAAGFQHNSVQPGAPAGTQ